MERRRAQGLITERSFKSARTAAALWHCISLAPWFPSLMRMGKIRPVRWFTQAVFCMAPRIMAGHMIREPFLPRQRARRVFHRSIVFWRCKDTRQVPTPAERFLKVEWPSQEICYMEQPFTEARTDMGLCLPEIPTAALLPLFTPSR